MPIETVSIPNDSAQLEGKLWRGEWSSDLNTSIGIILCHPHPLFYGTMDDHVIDSLFHAFIKVEIPVLKFNFRGVNNSKGTFENGLGEKKDVLSVIDFFKKSTNTHKIILVGYSFGSLIAFSVLGENESIAGFVGISHPFGLMKPEKRKEFSLDESLFKLKSSPIIIPKLFIIGDQDEFTPIKEFNDQILNVKGLKEVVIVPNESHFWRENELKIEKTCLKWIEKYFLN